MNNQIFGYLGTIGASPYLIGTKRLNSQYAKIETLLDQGNYMECISACTTLFEQIMSSLYLAVTGDKAQLSVILSDIRFWDTIGSKPFCDTAVMLQYACYRLSEEGGETDPKKAASLAKSGLDTIIEYTAGFVSKHGKKKFIAGAILEREDVRGHIAALVESFSRKMENAGCSDGFSMQPPYMNAGLLDFPEGEIEVWAGFIAAKLQRAGLLTTDKVETLDAGRVIDERVGLTNEYIRRASAKANGGVLLIRHFEDFDMPCLGGNLIDRALRTTVNAAEKYRGSLCIIVSGSGERVEEAFRRTERSGEYFPLVISLRQE